MLCSQATRFKLSKLAVIVTWCICIYIASSLLYRLKAVCPSLLPLEERQNSQYLNNRTYCGITDWPNSRVLPPTLSEYLCWLSARFDSHLTHNVLTSIRKIIGSNLKWVIDNLSLFPMVFLSTSRQIWGKYLEWVTASPQTCSIGVHQQSYRSMLARERSSVKRQTACVKLLNCLII
jgi:hypothetical protein